MRSVIIAHSVETPLTLAHNPTCLMNTCSRRATLSRRTPSWALSRRCSVALASDQAVLPRDMNSLSVDYNVVWGKSENVRHNFRKPKYWL